MRLIEALRYSQPTSISFVGAGGKTTAIFRLAREILAQKEVENRPRSVLVTTSTHIGTWQAALADHVYTPGSLREIGNILNELPAGVVLVVGDEKDNRLGGVDRLLQDELQRVGEKYSFPLLIEADGAHGRPMKAPAGHEPVIPEFSQQVVVVCGMSGIGKPLTEEWVHRPSEFSALSGLPLGEAITVQGLSRVLLDKNGGLKNIPNGSRRVVLLNQADTPMFQAVAKEVAERVVSNYEAGIVASLNPSEAALPDMAEHDASRQGGVHAVVEPIAGIILAAGGSSRFGKPKQLVDWKGQPLIRHVALAAVQAGLEPVMVVTGSSATQVQAVLKDMQLRIVNNSEWMAGMSSSIKAGINGLGASVGGAVFLQGDQPQIPSTLIRSLVETHQASMQPIIAPQIDGQRGNPVLFDVKTFPDLLRLEGDVGGRALFSRYPIQWVPWHDANLLIDVDTPEEYDRLLKI